MLTALGLPGGASTATPDAKSAAPREDTWHRAESDHFIVYSDVGEDSTVQNLRALEQFHDFLDLVLVPSDADPSEAEPKLRLYMVSDSDWLNLVSGSRISGLYSACPEGVTAFSALSRYDSRDYLKVSGELPAQDDSRTTLFHEYAHHAMFRRAAAGFPKWYVEGYAEYLSTFAYDNNWAWVGLVSNGSNVTLNYVNWSGFDRVLAPDENMSSGLLTYDGTDPVIFYAKAWLLTHYMLSDPQRTKGLDAYFVRLRQGEDPVAAFKAATGLSARDIHKTLRAYAKAIPYRKLELTLAEPRIDIVKLDPAEMAFSMFAAALGTCLPPEAGKIELKLLKAQADPAAISAMEKAETSAGDRDLYAEMKAQAPRIAAKPEYRLAVAYGEILYGDANAQIAPLSAISKDDPHYVRAQYLLGRAWLAEASKLEGADQMAARQKASQALAVAYRAVPNDPATLYFLARSFEGRPGFPDSNARNAALAARDAAPSVFAYASYAAKLEWLSADPDEAVFLLTPFATDPHNDKRADKAKTIIAAIKAGKPQAEILALFEE